MGHAVSLPGNGPVPRARALWPGPHNGLIAAIQRQLGRVLRPRYFVAIEERTYLGEPEGLGLVGVPDVSNHGRRADQVSEPAARDAVSSGAAVAVEVPVPERARETYLVIRSAGTGDVVAVIEILPTYAPVVLALGTCEYQLRHRRKGRALLRSLLDLPRATEDLPKILDEAGQFHINRHEYQEGLAIYRVGCERFPSDKELQLGRSCCAGHLDLRDEEIEAAEAAVAAAPDDARCRNDLGWPFLAAKRLGDALRELERAVALDPSYELAAENLRYCRTLVRRARRRSSPSHARRGG